MTNQRKYQEDYFGFVYLWHDIQTNRFYLGSHLGSIHDGYIGSNKWMKAAYCKRPTTFRRRILEWLTIQSDTQRGTLVLLHRMEQRWLDMIKDNELSISCNVLAGTNRYYNMKKSAAGGSHIGHKKTRLRPAWNLGVTSEMLRLRRDGYFCLLCDKPKQSTRPKRLKKKLTPKHTKLQAPQQDLTERYCDVCNTKFFSKTSRISCSQPCASITGRRRRKNKSAWNKGLPNPTAAENGKKGRDKLSNSVQGRKLMTMQDGSRKWIYPTDERYNLLCKATQPIPVKLKPIKLKPVKPKPIKRLTLPIGSQELKSLLSDIAKRNAKRGLDHPSAWLWILQSPEGKVLEVVGLKQFCIDHNLSMTAIQYNGSLAENRVPITRGKSKGWLVVGKRKGQLPALS